jgi:hypothetical protein
MTPTDLRTRIRHLVVAACGTIGVALYAAPLIAQDGGIALGAHAPSAAVQSLDGKPIQLSQVTGTGPALIEFWATLAAAQKKYGTQVKFVTVAVAINESIDRVRKHVAAHNTPGTVVFDADGNAASAYDAPATSYVVVFDKTGRVVYTGAGGTQDLDAAIRKAL